MVHHSEVFILEIIIGSIKGKMTLFIIEVKAHNPGHYTRELNQFAKYISNDFDSIFILTPFGFRDRWEEIKNCEIKMLCSKNNDLNKHPFDILSKLYNYQWEFYKNTVKYLSSFQNNTYIIHIWDFISVFPVWYFFRKVKVNKILNLKAIYREQNSLLGIKILGNIQGLLSKKLILNIADKYIVHTTEIFNEAVSIGIKKNKIFKIGIGAENLSVNLNRDKARSKLNISNNFFVILFFGTIRKEKGIYELFEHIKDIKSSFVLLIVGENKLDESISSLIKKYDVKANIILEIKYIPEKELELYFRASDAVVICHRKEFKGESGVLLKALQYQVPIIANLGNNSARIVENEQIGSTFDILLHEDILKAISYIKQNIKQIELNLVASQKKYSWENVIPYFKSIYFSN